MVVSLLLCFIGHICVSPKKFHCSKGLSYWKSVSLPVFLLRDTIDETLSLSSSQIWSRSFLDFFKLSECGLSNFQTLFLCKIILIFIHQTGPSSKLSIHSADYFGESLIAKINFLNTFSLQKTKTERERCKEQNQISDALVATVCGQERKI